MGIAMQDGKMADAGVMGIARQLIAKQHASGYMM
jgi:citrate lyase beta subunit